MMDANRNAQIEKKQLRVHLNGHQQSKEQTVLKLRFITPLFIVPIVTTNS